MKCGGNGFWNLCSSIFIDFEAIWDISWYLRRTSRSFPVSIDASWYRSTEYFNCQLYNVLNFHPPAMFWTASVVFGHVVSCIAMYSPLLKACWKPHTVTIYWSSLSQESWISHPVMKSLFFRKGRPHPFSFKQRIDGWLNTAAITEYHNCWTLRVWFDAACRGLNVTVGAVIESRHGFVKFDVFLPCDLRETHSPVLLSRLFSRLHNFMNVCRLWNNTLMTPWKRRLQSPRKSRTKWWLRSNIW